MQSDGHLKLTLDFGIHDFMWFLIVCVCVYCLEEEKDTKIIEIGVIHEDPAEAQKIAVTLNDVFIQEIREFYLNIYLKG